MSLFMRTFGLVMNLRHIRFLIKLSVTACLARFALPLDIKKMGQRLSDATQRFPVISAIGALHRNAMFLLCPWRLDSRRCTKNSIFLGGCLVPVNLPLESLLGSRVCAVTYKQHSKAIDARVTLYPFLPLRFRT